jgi:hypothetical protein
MKRLVIVMSLLVMASAGAGCAQLGSQYYKPSQEFSFYPPAGWRYNPVTEEITVMQSHHVKGHKFRPNLNIVVEPTDLVLEEYAEKQRTEFLPKLPGFRMVDEGYVTFGETWRATYDHYNPHFKETLRSILQLTLFNNKIYAITFMVPKKLWNSYRSMFYDSLDSFKFGEDAIPISEKKDSYKKPEIGAK